MKLHQKFPRDFYVLVPCDMISCDVVEETTYQNELKNCIK